MKGALVRMLLVSSLGLAACVGPPPEPSSEERRRWDELGLEVPANRAPVFYDEQGNHLPRVELDRFRDGFVHVPAAGDAGSFGVGAWHQFEDGRRVRLPGEPEAILTRRLGPPEFRGLTRGECERVRSAVASSTEEQFDSLLEALVDSGDPRSILVLTHVMLKLPWEGELDPRGRGDLGMRKVRVERALDHLVAATRHDGLSARYFRSLDPDRAESQRPDVEEAKNALIDWTLEHLDRFVWDAEAKQFQLPGAGGG
jgi:hypothetical protein